MLPHCAEPTAAQALALALADAMVAALNRPFPLAAGQADIGTSVGIAHFPAHGQTVDELIAFADVGLYEAKHRGRNVWAYSPKAAPLQTGP
ncbi:diguanylate cyclase domain-containing protein [Paracidovorax sp. MALMAid1276]|uniref:diguanylate cyclase domain-containing protein n=1 Tax=Paracidovorax sp. MALMAid1276 TaxID=3411631 RepID=UPI003B9C4852